MPATISKQVASQVRGVSLESYSVTHGQVHTSAYVKEVFRVFAVEDVLVSTGISCK